MRFFLQLKHWISELSAEICERLEQDLTENERRATLVTICYHYYQNKTIVSQSRSYTLNSYKPKNMTIRCVDIVFKSTQCPIAYLGISASKFIAVKGSKNFRNFFKSNNSEYHPKNVQIKNMKIENSHSKVNIKSIRNDLSVDNIISSYSNSNENNNLLSNKLKNIEKKPKNMQLNEQISDTKTDYSPTSKKLNNIITSLNERDKTNAFYERKINLNVSLNQNDFKESFFVNIFNSKESDLKDMFAHNELIELNDNINLNIELEKINVNNIKNENNFDEKLNLNAKEKNCKQYRNNEIENRPFIKFNQNNEINNTQNITKLEEIFPDLNNIDPTVLALLPLDLQKEAKLYMKAKDNKDNTKDILVKTSKGKNKFKINTSKRKKKNDISNFLIKKNSSN